MRHLSFRPALTLSGRKFKGPRGWAGKPLHPPLTNVPIGAYMLVAVFDVVSILGRNEEWSRDFYRAATFTILGGAAVSLFAAFTGFWDWRKSTEAGNQARRTVNAHAWTMVGVTTLVLTSIALRVFTAYGDDHTPIGIVALSVVIALLTIVGGTIGGSVTYDYGFNVETAGDDPVWHRSEVDLLPGERPTPPTN